METKHNAEGIQQEVSVFYENQLIKKSSGVGLINETKVKIGFTRNGSYVIFKDERLNLNIVKYEDK